MMARMRLSVVALRSVAQTSATVRGVRRWRNGIGNSTGARSGISPSRSSTSVEPSATAGGFSRMRASAKTAMTRNKPIRMIPVRTPMRNLAITATSYILAGPGMRSPQTARLQFLRAGQDQIEPAVDFLEVGGITAIELDGGGSGIANLGQRLVYFGPFDFALAQRHPLAHFSLLELEVLDVELHDALAERANPVLRVAGNHHVADIEVRADPRALELVDVPG